MSIFNKILEKLGIKKDGSKPEDAQTSDRKTPAKPNVSPTSSKTSSPATRTGRTARPATSGPARPNVATPARSPAAPAMSEVDVVKQLEQKASGKGLNWRTSIVDLLKLLDIDSGYEARVELAKELGAPADMMGDSARMNTWLHKEVMRRIAANGGNVPRELLD